MMPKGNIMILVETPMPAKTSSEICPARLLSMIAATTARPERNIEEEPTLMIWDIMSLVGWKFLMEMRRML